MSSRDNEENNKETFNSGRFRKSIVEWTPHSFVFRYLITRELARWKSVSFVTVIDEVRPVQYGRTKPYWTEPK